ncbi:MAG: hypothetical protein LBD45_03975 [Bacteroidales bacterium]|nr:hypothetical protein [Bacteroidales bacterium]
MDIFIILLLMGIAIGLIVIEIFFLPGTTLAGIAGGIFAVVGIWYAYSQVGSMGGHITLAVSVVAFGAAFIWFIKSNALNKIALNEEVVSSVESLNREKIKVGDEGLTLSRLNPMGKARINGETVEVKSTGDFIDQNKTVVVLKVFTTNALVELKKD